MGKAVLYEKKAVCPVVEKHWDCRADDTDGDICRFGMLAERLDS